MVFGSREPPCVCRVSPMQRCAVFRFYSRTSSECERAFLDPRASSECSPVWVQVPECMVCMCVLGISNPFHANSTRTTPVAGLTSAAGHGNPRVLAVISHTTMRQRMRKKTHAQPPGN